MIEIVPYAPSLHDEVIALSLRAWEPVFRDVKQAVPGYVYDAFYPAGWAVRQASDIDDILRTNADATWVALDDGVMAGWVGIRCHPGDQMGEIYILAVDPSYQRRGVAAALIDYATARMRDAGMKIAMVETGGDPGHAPSRATYEHAGFERWPVARYFRKL